MPRYGKHGRKLRGRRRGKKVTITAHVGERVLTPKQNRRYERMILGRKRVRKSARR